MEVEHQRSRGLARPERIARSARHVAGVMLASAFVAGGAVSSSADVTDLKTFTVDVDGTVATPVPGASGVYSGDADAVITVVIANTSSQQALGSADVVVPSPFRVVAAAADTVPGGPVLELRSLGLAPGASLSFPITVDVETCSPTTSIAFQVTAKQSNDFNGTGNDVTLVTGSSDQSVEIVGNCSLAFVTQPRSADRGAVITSAPFAPSGSPISVELRDGGGTDRVESVNAVVGLSATNPAVTSPGLAGTISATAVAGLATFSPGPTLAVSAFGYRLVASSPDVTSSVPSDAFDIVDTHARCAVGASCSASTSAPGQSATVAFGSGSVAGNLLVSIGAADAPVFECAGYPRGELTVSQFLFTGAADRLGTFTVTIAGGSRPLKSYEVCWAAPAVFATKSGTPPTVQGVKPGTSLPLYVGLLPDCAKRSPVPPCVSGRSYDSKTRRVTLSVLVTSDDPWRY